MNKKFEYIDDNPGAYFGMLVESVENKKDTKKKKINESTKYEYLENELAEVSNDKDIERAYDENELTIVKLGNVYYMEHCPDELVKKVKTLMKKYYPNLVYLYDIDLMNYSSQNESLKEDKNSFRNWIEKKVGKQMSNMRPTKIGYKHGRPYYAIDFTDGTSDDYFIDFDKEEVEKCESLKEDKFIPQDKMSKKDRKELDSQKNTWGNTNPVTRVQPNKKAYDRKRDSKVIMDESKNLNERELLLKYAGKFKRGDIYKWIGTNTPSLELYPDDFSIDGVKDNLLKDGFKLVDKYDGNRDEDSYLVFTKTFGNDKIIAAILFNEFNVTLQIEINPEDEETLEYFDESLKESKKLNESSDGWDESKLYDLSEILDEIYNLQYEVKNTIRGAYTNAHTYEELGYYVHNLGSNLMDIGDEIMEMEDEDDEDED